MFSWITSAFSIIKGLLDLWKTWQHFQDQQRKAAAERAHQEMQAGVEDLKKAKTDEEIFNAQKRIVRNKPS